MALGRVDQGKLVMESQLCNSTHQYVVFFITNILMKPVQAISPEFSLVCAIVVDHLIDPGDLRRTFGTDIIVNST